MGRGKQLKFKDNQSWEHVIQPGKDLFEHIKGRWLPNYFKNDNPLIVELACGRGEYTTGLAKIFPAKNFVGVDIKGSRIWNGASFVDTEKIRNAAFLRTYIQNLDEFFAESEIDEIWIVHPDPRPKNSDERRRLTHPRFLDMYSRIVRSGGLIRLKTDDQALFDYSLEVLRSRADVIDLEFTFDLYSSEFAAEHYGIVTRYETEFTAEGRSIKYLKFRFGP